MKNYFILLISILFLAGCSGEAGEAAAKEDVAKKPAEKAVVELKTVPLGYDGLGGLTRETAVGQAPVQAVFPSLTCRDVTNSKGTVAMTQAFRTDRGKAEEVLRVLPNPETGKIGQILIKDTDLLEGFNAKIGQTHKEISDGGVTLSCAAGTGEAYEGKILCRSAKTGTISYVFNVAEWKGSKKRLPKDDVVAGATLSEVIWAAPE